jgi:hypothetical protein
MSLERAIKNIVRERGASLGRLVRVGGHLEGQDCHMLLEAVEELFVDIR